MRIILAFILCFSALQVRGQGTPRTLETMAQLLATDPVKFATAGKLVYLVGGYRTNGDWGAPREIAWNAIGAATTNLGCVWDTVTTNGQWVAKDCESGEVDVRWFGIQPGSTNYAAANQAAWVNLVDYATADGINDHKPVRFPVGSFYFTGPLNLYNSTATPGAGYDSGRFIVQGSGQESSWVYLTGLTNNGFVGVYSGIQIRDLTVSATAERKAATVTDAWTGNAIHIEKVSGYPAFHDIRNVVVRDQPGSGIFLSGAVELLSAKNVIAMNNMREGFTLTRKGAEAGPFMNRWESCRASGNQQGGWSVTNAYNNVFTHCEAIDNYGEAHFRTFSGVNLTFDNCDIESPSSKTAPAAPLTTNTVVFGTNLVVVPGYDFAAAGVSSGQYMIVTNSVSNDRAWRVLSAVGDTITVDGVWGFNTSEASTNNITLAFTTAIPGLVLRAAIGARVVGGYWGTLPTAIVLQNPVDSVIDWPYFVNASLVNWVGSECVLRTTAGGTNQMFRFRPTAPTGFRTVFRDQYGDTGWKDSLFYGAIPSYFRVGDESKASPFEVYGGAGGASVIKMYRPELPQTMGFAVSQWAGAGKMNILDADDFVVAAGGVGDALEPRWFIGQDGAASFPNTNVVLAVGRRITGETNATGVSLKLEGQAGTGTGQSGWVLLGNFDPTTAGTNVQTASKYRLGVHPGGVKVHDVGLTLPSTPYAGAALEVTSTSKGFLPPRMTTAQRLAIASPIAGLSVYDTTISDLMVYDGSVWHVLSGTEADVRSFGAVPDDGLDDTTAIQSAIQAMEVVSGVVKFPRGTFDVDRLYITNASLLGAGYTYSTVDGDSTKVRTALQHKIGATGHMINVERSTGGNYIRGFDLLGHRELNLVNPKAIVSASTRTNFVVATNDVPATPVNVSAFPYYGFAFFYSATSNYIGHALISSVTTNTGEIGIRYGWDNYATTAGLLTSSELVCFSPLESASGYFTDRASPTAAGWAGINITRTVSQGIVCKIEDVKVIRFHTGIRVVAGSGIDYDNVWCQANTFAGIATAVPAYGSDDHGNRVYCQGFYASDVGNTDPALGTWTDEYYRSTAFGLYAPSSRGVWLDFSSSRNVINVLDSLASDLYFGYVLADVPIKHGWLTVNGRSGALDGGVDIGYICVSTPYFTLPTGMVYENGIDRCAIGVVNNDTLTRRLSIRTLSVGRFAGSPAANDFASAVSIPQWTATTNRVSIGSVVNKDGATNLVATGRAAYFADPNWFITPAERKFGVLADQDTDDLLIAADGAANIRINSTAIASSNTLAIYRSDTSSQVGFNRTGSSSFGVLPSGENLLFRDDTKGLSAVSINSSATEVGLQLGELSGTPRTPVIYGTTASGTNVAATSMIVYGPRGTGNSTPAAIRFATSDIGTSGTTAQTRTEKARLDSTTVTDETPLSLFVNSSLSRVKSSNGVLNVGLNGGNSSNFFRGDGVFTNIVPVAPTNNGAYVLFVTNGVASWIAHP